MNDGNAATTKTPWFRDPDYFQSELEKRLAHQIGTAILQGHMAEVRASMEAGRADHVTAALDRLQDEMADLRHLVAQSQKAPSGPQDAEAIQSPPPTTTPRRKSPR